MSNSFKKIGLLLGSLLLMIGLGSGMDNAFAGQDAESSLINWFGAKRTASEHEIANVITAEKDRLMGELKIALQGEKQRAEEELAAFTENEKRIRTAALQEYAAALIENMETDLTEEKEAIIADLDAKHNQAIKDLEKKITPTKPIAVPEAEAKPDTTPVPEAGTQPVLPSEPDAETEPSVVPEPLPETIPESAL
ncbi:hypothetical protein ACFSFY_14265 [Sporosarcina siberiensis]|uniref:Uncharacterized protein n=1 Tax=Sporosarcina siberiensis TaxID=1365606 RepID=A0ABW4SI24_9BACL